MGRRRKNTGFGWVEPAVSLAALGIGAAYMSPVVRTQMSHIGAVLLWILAVPCLGVFLFIVYRMITTKGQPSDLLPHADATPQENVYGGYQSPSRRSFSTAANATSAFSNPTPTSTPSPTSIPAPPPIQPLTLEQQVARIDWFQFEKLMEIVYRKQGYGVTRRGGAQADGGIDLVLEKNGEKTAVQCKHWKSQQVRVNTVREFVGAMTDSGIRQGILVTSSNYTEEAKALADRNGVRMVNQDYLVQLLTMVHAGHDREVQMFLNDRRKFCPKCESEMVQRTARKGENAGNQFWGCSQYPRCKYILTS